MIGGAALALACGGVGGVGGYAGSYAAYQADEAGIPCPSYRLGKEATIGSFTYVFQGTELVDAETRLPWIRNSDERRSFAKPGVKALVVRYKLRNDSPVAKARDSWFEVVGTDGVEAGGGPYNEDLYLAKHWLDDPSGDYAPGKWYDTVDVVAIQPEAADGAAAHLQRKEEQLDAWRKKVRVLVEQAVVDLGTPEPGDAIIGDDATKPSDGSPGPSKLRQRPSR